MKRMLSWATKPAYLAPALLWLITGALGLPVTAQGQVDPYQREIVFYNDLTDRDGNGITIYPLIAAPQASNCNNANFPSGTSLRIIVNGQGGAGISPGESVTVNIPKEQPCPPRGGFYDAVRIIVLLTSVQAFESQFPAALSNQKTVPIIAPWTTGICPGCTAGKAAADYGLDAPGQLLEYTIISQINGAKAPDNQNNPAGVPEIDFDVSYVDDVFLPVAMALADGGATQFMGSGLPYGQFPKVISDFLTMGSGWSSYAVYADPNWGHSILQNLVPLSSLSPRPVMVPSGAQLIAGVINSSGLYTPSNDNGAYTRQCVDPNMANDPPHNQMCALPPPVGAGLMGDC